MKDKQMLIFNFILHLLWTGRGFSAGCVAFLGCRELKYIEKPGLSGTVGGTREWYFPELGNSVEMISKN